MTRWFARRAALTCIAWAGCAAPPRSVSDAFPVGFEADPWTLRDAVWSGTAAQAADALGPDWSRIQPFGPRRAWLAVYTHARLPGRTLTVRAFELDSHEAARRLYDEWRPDDAAEFRIGDGGCYSPFGVTFVRGALFFDIFGNVGGWEDQIQSAYLAGCIERRLPAAPSARGP